MTHLPPLQPPLPRGPSQAPATPSPQPPLRPGSPSTSYRPGPDADPVLNARLHHMHQFAETHGVSHPFLPERPEGLRTLTNRQAECLFAFKSDYLRRQVESMATPQAQREFLSSAFTQTYRQTPNGMAANHPTLVAGPGGLARFPSGSFPAGTTEVITSLPLHGYGDPPPSESHHLRAYLDRTNAHHAPGSSIDCHMLYHPGLDKVYLLDGDSRSDGRPRYWVGRLPGAPTPSLSPVQGLMDRGAAFTSAPGSPRVPTTPVLPAFVSAPPSLPSVPAPHHEATRPPSPVPMDLDTPRAGSPELPAFFYAEPPQPGGQAHAPLSVPSTPSSGAATPTGHFDINDYIQWPASPDASRTPSRASTPEPPPRTGLTPPPHDPMGPPAGYATWMDFLNDPNG